MRQTVKGGAGSVERPAGGSGDTAPAIARDRQAVACWPLERVLDVLCSGRSLAASVSRYCAQRLAGPLIEVPTAWLCDEHAFSLADTGWHYYRAILADYDRNPQVSLEHSTFYRFFTHEELRSARDLNDVLFLHDPGRGMRPGAFRFHLNTYPWGGWTRRHARVGGWPFGWYYDQVSGDYTRDRYGYRANIWHGPGDPYALRRNWQRTLELYRHLRGQGYSPLRHGAIPAVILLRRRDGAVRAVRYEGHHRLALLAHLGHQRVKVVVPRETLGVIDERQVLRWYDVREGLCTADQALEVFHAFFDLNGRERLHHLGLLSAY